MNYIIAIGMFQAMVAAYLLWQNGTKNKADNLLLLLLLCISSHLAIKFAIYNFVNDADVRLQMNTFIGFCYGPLIYLYALKKKDEQFIAINKWYLFLPMILGGVGYLTVAALLFTSDKTGHTALHIYNTATSYSISFFNLYFHIRAARIATQLTEKQSKEKQLIRRISYLLMIVCVIGLGYGTAKLFINVDQNFLIRSICYAALSIVCLIILSFKYVGVMQPQANNSIPLVHAASDPIASMTMEPVSPERRSVLTPAEQQKIWGKLQTYLTTTEAYTDAELSLEKLSKGIGVSRYHLSETLNSYASKSFYQYINELRISRVVEQMESLTRKGLPINILTLAYDNGFKAKSTFNQYFKKITGHTPSDYIRNIATSDLEAVI